MIAWLLQSEGWYFQSTASGFASEENERENLEGRNRTCDGQRVAGVWEERKVEQQREGLSERQKVGLGGGEGRKLSHMQQA
jgi:hypothetical protein